MSTTVDQRVVEMRFDNRQFESNVQTSMSTLDKLKRSLNLTGSAKGLENLNTAAKRVDMSGLGRGIESVQAKFSALQVIGVTALANITNSAVNAGKRIASALTIDPVKTGFQEYETQINAIQTILANTQKEGTTVEIVNKALDELNTYADKTIYNFTEMTRNIGTFTAAGVKLQTSVDAIQGIANLAAVSGSTSQQASTAMYQLSQALSSGTVRLMDWNSVVNAGMGGQVFQDALKETSELLGTGAEAAIKAEGSFRDSLNTGWLTSEVLTETLKKFTTSGAIEKVAEYTGLSQEAVQSAWESAEAQYGEADAIAKVSEELAKQSGKSADTIKSTLEFAKTAEDAATKVKTLSQLWDTLKEAAQSGWSQSWRIIVGDFEEAKELFTGLSNFLGGFIQRSADSRNSILEGALSGNPFSTLAERIEKVTGATEAMAEATKDYSDITNKVINGDFGDGQARIEALTEAGYDWVHVQNLVNEKLGDSTRYATDYKESQEGTAKAQAKTVEELVKMSDAQLENLGFTKKEIQAFRDLEEQSEKTGIPTNDLIKDLDQLNGRTLLINSFKNAGDGLVAVFEAVGKAWKDIFWDGASDDEIIERKTEILYNATAAIHKFSVNLKSDNLPIEEITRTLRGLFAAADIVATIFGSGLKIVFKALSAVLEAFDMNIFDLTAKIGDAIVAFRDWLFEGNLLAKAINGLVDKLPIFVDKFKEWFAVLKETPAVQKFIDAIQDFKSTLRGLFDPKSFGTLEDFAHDLGVALARALLAIPEIMVEIGKDIWAGFQNGLESGFDGSIIGKIVSFALELVAGFAEALGVQSPSWKAYDIAVDFFQGAINGIKAMASKVWEALRPVTDGIVNIFKSFWDFLTDESGSIEWGKIFALGGLAGIIWTLKKISDAINGFSEVIGSFADLSKSLSDAINNISGAIAKDFKAKAFQKIAISIALLAASIWLIAQVDDIGKLWNAVGIIVVLSGVLIGLAIAMDKLSKASVKVGKEGVNLDGLKSGLLQIGLALILLAATVKLIGSMKLDEATRGFEGLAALAVGLIVFVGILSEFGKNGAFGDMDKVGKMLTKLAFALLLMVAVVKLAGGLSAGEMFKGIIFAGAFAIFVRSITAVAKSAGNNVSKVGGMMLRLTIAMGLMVGVVKLIGMLSVGEMIKGAAFAAAFVIFIKYLVNTTKIGKKQKIAEVSGLILSVSFSLLLLVGVCKIISTLSIGEMIKGGIVIAAFLIMLTKLMKALTIGNEQKVASVASAILAMSVAIAIMAGVAILLGMIDTGDLAKGIVAVGILGLIMSEMVKSLKGARNAKGAILMMAISIGVMAAAVAALSLIKPEDLFPAVTALSILMGMFALMVKANTGAKASIKTTVLMLIAVVALAGIIACLSSLEVNSTLEIVASISLLMLAMAASLQIMGNVKSVSQSALNALSNIALVAMFMGVILALISKLNPGPTLEIAASLSLVLIAMSAAALILSKIGPMGAASAAGAKDLLVVIGVVAAILIAIGGIVAQFDAAKKFVEDAIPILENIGKALGSLIGGFIGGIGVGVTDALPAIGQNIANFMNKLALASKNASGIKPGSFDGAADLIAVMGGIALTTVGTTLSDIFTLGGTSMEKFQTDGVAFFAAMKAIAAEATGFTMPTDKLDIRWVNSLIDAIGAISSTSISSSWSDVFTLGGTSMEKFETDAKAFFTTMKNIAKEASGFTMPAGKLDLSWLNSLLTALSDISANSRNSSISDVFTSIFSDDSTAMAKFQTDGVAFFKAMKTIAAEASGFTIEDGAFDSVITAASKLGELQNDISGLGSVIDFFLGRDDLGTFGTNIGLFADGIGALRTAMGENGITEETIASIMNTGDAIKELIKTLPEEGFFDGKMNLTEFSQYITDFGTAMSGFGSQVSGMDYTAIDATITAANQIKALINSLVGLDTSGVAAFTGIGTGGFGADGAVSDIAKAISGYCDEVGNIDTASVNTSVSAATTLRSLISGLVGLDASGIENFKVEDIGSAMKTYADKVAKIDTGVVASSVGSANRLKSLISGLASLDASGVSNFKVGSIGTAMKNYSNSVSSLNVAKLSSSVAEANKLKDFIASLSGLDTSGVGSFKSAVEQLGTLSVDNMIDSFTSAGSSLTGVGGNLVTALGSGAKLKQSTLTSTINSIITNLINSIRSKATLFKTVGMSMMANLADGLKANADRVKNEMTSSAGRAVTSIRGYYSSFYNAGSYLVSGFANGISSNAYRASAKARAMAKAAKQAAEYTLGIASPSKVFYKIGSYTGQGFVNALSDYTTRSYSAGSKMAEAARTGLSNAIGKVTDLLNGDMDAQPTIRPVIDLSDVESGTNAINSMLKMGSTIGMSANVGIISSRMNQRNQNGINSEVVSAIDKLRKDLGNVGNTSYNVNGITYDDGSNMAELVKGIIREARIQRRV